MKIKARNYPTFSITEFILFSKTTINRGSSFPVRTCVWPPPRNTISSGSVASSGDWLVRERSGDYLKVYSLQRTLTLATFSWNLCDALC